MRNIFPSDEFVVRRAKLIELVGRDVNVLVQSAPPVDGFTVFRQTNEFMYLTGLNAAQSLLLIADGVTTLFLPSRGTAPPGEGEIYGAEDVDAVIRITGVDRVLSTANLTRLLPETGLLLTPMSPAEGRLACQDTLKHAAKLVAEDEWEYVEPREHRMVKKLEALRPNLKIADLSPSINKLRIVKSQREVAVMRRTGKLSALAVAAAMRATKPGVYEYQLGAIADYIYGINGAISEGYRPIIATGDNIWHPHYYQNNCRLKDGDLVLMDYAPDLYNYTNDIGRLWPVNGRFDPEQKEIYQFVVTYHKELLKRIRPGVLPRQVLEETASVMHQVIDRTAFSRKPILESAKAMLAFRGHLSHPVGMSVHDVGTYFDRPLEAGMVFAVDPQLWIKEEKKYVRVEDTVTVTSDGVEVLTDAVPIEIVEIESLIASHGILEAFPPIEEFTNADPWP